ncbi:radical SAM protein [Candidatus Methylospira mobilis]|uniref:B12-binding domain-containing radical SAM protein n=1 Tax=Candidatus Methylospira mobilis TaxID=1808979 RepID=UPI0028E67E39|nr:radical SAM protein [Candidatus Methylospira mobilis]WNV04541.1 radical SAM protein [Candidatus Methylospira mobilis]
MSIDAGRGCPFLCSFCTIINVQGRKSRYRHPDDVERCVRTNVAQGFHRLFISDDNFARNQNWEPILDRPIHLREVEKLKISFSLQVDTLCHRIPNFIEKAARAGVKRVFIGLENINPANLLDARKKHNRISEYRKMLLAWKHAKVVTYCGYILGFPKDTPEAILRDIETIKEELPIDLLEFFTLTPLPGSEDHKKLSEAGVNMNSDLNNYDVNHVVIDHPLMSRAEWEQVSQAAWKAYYSPVHIETVLRRAMAAGSSPGNTLFNIVWFKGCVDIEKVHPLEGGYLRLKSRHDRRPGLPTEPFGLFYPKFFAGIVWKQMKWIAMYLRLRLIYIRVKRDPQRHEYRDAALEAVTDDGAEPQ